MKLRALVAALLVAGCMSASAANRVLGISEGGTGTASGPSAVPFTAPNATTSSTPAARAGHMLNVVDDFGAYGDGQQTTATVTATANNPTVTVAGANYSASDVGKVWAATGLGATLTTGSITAAALTDGGSGYTSIPTITVNGTTSATLLYPVMQIESVSVASGGSGCANGTQTFTIPGLAQQDTAQTFTGTVSGGALSGSLTLTGTPGAFVYGVSSIAAPTGASCTYQPTVNVTYKVSSIRISNGGMGVPLSGVTMSVSGGNPTTAATLGAVTVAATTKVHKTTIVAVNSATSVTLAAAPTTPSAGTQTVFYGHDDAPALQAAVNSCKPVSIPSGSYWVGSTVTLPSMTALPLTCKTALRGAGRDMTTIRAMPGLAASVMETVGFSLLTGSNSSAGSHQAVIEDLTIDGNKSAQDWPSSGTPDAVNGLAFYGAALKMSNVAINNVLGHCLLTEWVANANVNGATLPNGMVPALNHVAIDTCGRNGFWYKGPHDGHFEDLMILDASQEQDVAFDAIHAEGYANGRFLHIHPWHRSTSLNRAAWDFYSGSGGNQIVNSHLEGARGWIYHAGSRDIVTGSLFYALFPAAGSSAVVFAGSQNSHIGNVYAGPGDGSPIYGFQYGVSSSAKGAQTMLANGTVNGFALAPFNFAFDGGGNTISANGYKNAISGVAWVGTPVASSNTFQWHDRSSGAVSYPGNLNSNDYPQTSIVVGGSNNTLTAQYSTVTGGKYCTDRGRIAYECFGGANMWGVAGTSQIGRTTLVGGVTNAAAGQLTADGAVAGAANALNIPLSAIYKLRLSLICRDHFNGDWASWSEVDGVLSRGASGAPTYAGGYSTSSPPSQSQGTGSTATLTISADAINNGLAPVVTVPNGHTWRCEMPINAAEVQ